LVQSLDFKEVIFRRELLESLGAETPLFFIFLCCGNIPAKLLGDLVDLLQLFPKRVGFDILWFAGKMILIEAGGMCGAERGGRSANLRKGSLPRQFLV
jgi:hypothetical protein